MSMSSGETAIGTAGDTPVNLITVSGRNRNLFIVNEGTTPGFFSLNNFTTPGNRIPASSSIGPYPIIDGAQITVQIKRVPSGSDMTGVWAFTN